MHQEKLPVQGNCIRIMEECLHRELYRHWKWLTAMLGCFAGSWKGIRSD